MWGGGWGVVLGVGCSLGRVDRLLRKFMMGEDFGL